MLLQGSIQNKVNKQGYNIIIPITKGNKTVQQNDIN